MCVVCVFGNGWGGCKEDMVKEEALTQKVLNIKKVPTSRYI